MGLWRRPTRKSPRCCGSTPSCSGSPAVTRSGRGTTRRRPSPSAGTRTTSAAIPDTALTTIPGVGSSIAAKIAEYRRTGTIKAVDELRAKVPAGRPAAAKVPGVGPKRALQIAGELGVTSVGELAEAVRSGRLRGVAGFGPKSEERILRGIGVAVERRRAARGPALAAGRRHRGRHLRGARRARWARRPTPAARLIRTQDIRGDLHTHTDLTDGIVSLEGMIAAAEARGYEYYAVTDHAPNLVMQRMTDEKMLAQRDRAARARGHHRHGPAARQRAQHRGRRQRGLGRGLPERLRHLRRVGSLQVRAGPGDDDETVRHRRREPAREHHRPPADPQDRPPPAGRGRPGRAVRGVRPHRDRAGGQRLAGPDGPAAASTSRPRGRRA